MTEKTLIRRVGLVVRRFLRRLRRCYPENFTERLEGACAIGSATLARVLRRCGMPARLVIGAFYKGDEFVSFHAWVEVDDRIVDVTATQFGRLPAVLVTDTSDDRYHPSAKGRAAVHGANTWSGNQAPKRHQRDIAETVRAVCG